MEGKKISDIKSINVKNNVRLTNLIHFTVECTAAGWASK